MSPEPNGRRGEFLGQLSRAYNSSVQCGGERLSHHVRDHLPEGVRPVPARRKGRHAGGGDPSDAPPLGVVSDRQTGLCLECWNDIGEKELSELRGDGVVLVAALVETRCVRVGLPVWTEHDARAEEDSDGGWDLAAVGEVVQYVGRAARTVVCHVAAAVAEEQNRRGGACDVVGWRVRPPLV